jgi:hypothetical protein
LKKCSSFLRPFGRTTRSWDSNPRYHHVVPAR